MASSVTLSATGVTRIGIAGATPVGAGGWYLVFTGSSWTGSIVLAQDRNAPGSVSRPIASGSLTNVGYFDPSLNTAVSSGTAITATGNWQVQDVSYDLYLNYTHTSGSVTVTIMPGSFLTAETEVGPITAAADLTSGTFGANIPDTGTFVFPSQLGFGTKVISTTALATPSAVSVTTGEMFASTVSGATLMGYGTTGDVTLKNRAGTDVIVVTSNTLNVTMAGAIAFVTTCTSTTALATPSAYAATQSTQFASTVSGAVIMGFGTTHDVALKNQAGTTALGVVQNSTTIALAGAGTFVTSLSSTTALATPSALAATQFTAFASTVSGSTLMGFGTTGDVTLKGRAGTDVLVVTANTLDITLAGAVTETGVQPTSVGTTPGTAGTAISWAPSQGGNTTIATTGVGGKGAGWTMTTGAGGTAAVAVTAGTGGAGGDYAVTTGAGAVSAVTGSGTGTGGKGGAIAFLTGVGGATSTSTGVNVGGASGAITVTTAVGGASTNGSSNTGGASGVITIATGNGGAGATAQGASGAINLTTGTTTATVGAINLNPGGVQVINVTKTGATTGLVIIDGSAYGAGVASLRMNGLSTAATASQTGTMTNAPSTGNPVFWMPISIAGSIRYFPCWA